MIFKDFWENLLGSRVKVKLVRKLVRDATPASERELAQSLGVSNVAVNKTMKELHDANFVIPMKIGGATVWRINQNSYAYCYLRNSLWLEPGEKENPLEKLKQLLRETLEPLEPDFAAIFGSVAEGTEKPNSDIDLYLRFENQEQFRRAGQLAKLEKNVFELFGNRLSVTYATDARPGSKQIVEAAARGIRLI